NSKEEIDPVSKKIFHYGRYSYLKFEKGQNIDKKIDKTKNGIIVDLYRPVRGIQPQRSIELEEIVNGISDKSVIYLGERHTNYEDHKAQLQVIMGLFEKGRKFAIGMEMFQKPFQKALDEYISGAISEKDFLKKSQYFKRWGVDYNLYREIIEFAKAKNIPVIALNISSEIIKKVSRGGLDALTQEEKKEIPGDMDMSDDDYRNWLKKIFEEHENLEAKNFDYFYQSQILWDETMAHSVDLFLRERPDHQIIVLSGIGHIMYGSGIPKRAYRLNSKDYVTLVPNTRILEENEADFVLFPEHLSPPQTPKLGVILKEFDSGVTIKGFQPDSIAKKAGLRKDDILVSLDNSEIEAIEDVRIFMFDKKEGESVKIKVLRKRFLFGEREIEFTVTL
ncbi:MAG: ChaN family lipoprotein, partial [Nitrospirota bacterium]